jgi:ketosteroid isomerase-like protein
VSSHADTNAQIVHDYLDRWVMAGHLRASKAVDALLAENQQLEADRLEAIRLVKKTQRLRERALAENQQLRDALDETKVEVEALHRILRDAHAAVRVEER